MDPVSGMSCRQRRYAGGHLPIAGTPAPDRCLMPDTEWHKCTPITRAPSGPLDGKPVIAPPKDIREARDAIRACDRLTPVQAASQAAGRVVYRVSRALIGNADDPRIELVGDNEVGSLIEAGQAFRPSGLAKADPCAPKNILDGECGREGLSRTHRGA